MRDVDHGAKALLESVSKMKSQTLRVGILADAGAEDHGGISMADVATFHEFGTETIPQRSFIRGWFDEQEASNRAAIRTQYKRVLKGELTVDEAFGQLGALFVARIQQRIVDRIQPPLKAKTIQRKASDVPLVDTGQLKSSVTWEVQ